MHLSAGKTWSELIRVSLSVYHVQQSAFAKWCLAPTNGFNHKHCLNTLFCMHTICLTYPFMLDICSPSIPNSYLPTHLANTKVNNTQ